jgi:hypothetical protein
MTLTSGWLIYRVMDGKAQVIGIYDQYEKAQSHLEVLGRALSEGWMIVGVPFVGWESFGTTTTNGAASSISTRATEQGAG